MGLSVCVYMYVCVCLCVCVCVCFCLCVCVCEDLHMNTHLLTKGRVPTEDVLGWY